MFVVCGLDRSTFDFFKHWSMLETLSSSNVMVVHDGWVGVECGTFKRGGCIDDDVVLAAMLSVKNRVEWIGYSKR
jgi:hypothetical protein